MRHITTLLILIFSASIFAQNNVVKTAGVSYTAGAPTFTPGRTGSQVAIDTVTGYWYEYNGTSWSASGYRVQTISGCAAPAYAPAKYQSRLVINACTAGQGGPELYYWTGSVWLQINEGQTYTAGTGIAISGGNVITNTAPDQTVTMTDGTGIDVTGTYPNFTVTNSSPNVVQVLSIAGQDLTLSGGGGTVEIPATGAAPANQIVYGTGASITSNQNLKRNGDTLAVNAGNILIRPTNNFSNYYTLNIWPRKNNGTTANMGILRIPMDSISNRANTDPYHGNFPAWLKKISWDKSINVPAGGPLDTTGNLLVNEGFNFDQSDLTYNPKFPQFYWSTEMKYRAGTNTKSWIESHWEFRDTLGRIARPISTAYSYDGSYADVSFQTDYKTFGKGRDQAALTPGESNWENVNFITGQYDVNYNLSQNIKKKYSGNLIQKFKNKTPGNTYMNILRHEANDVVQVGDSAGVRIYNDLYFGVNGSNPAKIKAAQTALRFDSMIVEFVSQPGVLRNHRYLAPGIAASAGLLFDGNKLLWGKYAVAESIFGVNINAPNDALFITSAGKLVYNSSSAFADFDLNQRTNAFGGGLRLLNTGGIYTTLRANSSGHLTITGNSVALSDKVIATTNDATLFEGVVSAPPGSIGMMGGSSNGNLWVKKSGTGNTGWKQVVTTEGSVASAALEITSTTQGVLPPRMTQAQRDAISSPATALTLYCTDCTATDASTGVMQTYNGATWKNNW